MNKDYDALALCLNDLGFLEPGSDVRPVAEGLAEVWGTDTLSAIASSGNFSFRGLTKEFNKLLFKYPIRVPERFSLVIRALLTQENICLTLDPSFNFLNAAFPYVARRLLTDPDPNLRARLFKVVIVKGKFEWARLRELVQMAEAGASGGVKVPARVAGPGGGHHQDARDGRGHEVHAAGRAAGRAAAHARRGGVLDRVDGPRHDRGQVVARAPPGARCASGGSTPRTRCAALRRKSDLPLRGPDTAGPDAGFDDSFAFFWCAGV